jgi:transposase-like protein
MYFIVLVERNCNVKAAHYKLYLLLNNSIQSLHTAYSINPNILKTWAIAMREATPLNSS